MLLFDVALLLLLSNLPLLELIVHIVHTNKELLVTSLTTFWYTLWETVHLPVSGSFRFVFMKLLIAFIDFIPLVSKSVSKRVELPTNLRVIFVLLTSQEMTKDLTQKRASDHYKALYRCCLTDMLNGLRSVEESPTNTSKQPMQGGIE